ncbi:MAG: AAA family ATPase [Acidimicrobiaceae bacterium]|nr:AAA family ATPase [Acidimicrobiaceae bacterium]
MRLVWLKLRRFRRFQDARVNLDAPVIALVGPNEAGKSTLLEAIVAVGRSGEFNPRDITRGLQPQGRVLEATFLLDEDDREALQDSVPEALDVRWYRVRRNQSGDLRHETVPPVPWAGEAAERVRRLLTKLRSLKWAKSIDEEVLDRINTVISLIPDDQPCEYSEQELAEIEHLGTILADIDSRNRPATLQRTGEAIAQMIADEAQPRPQETALELLSDRSPEILDFTESDRTIHTNYNLQDPGSWTNGIRNLSLLGGFDLSKLAEAVGGLPEIREDILRRANRQLDEVFSVSWSQSKLTVHLNVQGGTLEIFVASDNGGLYRWEERSDGLRTYLALIAFLSSKDLSTPPVLVFDEAESHLHWDAQADLINVLYDQNVVSQVIYSTHSPGCLPHDLGHGVRAVIPTKPDRSKVENWIWATAAGFRPMLTHMGASSAALTPHRYAVATEGVADFILLPSLLREATEADLLPYQVVPGLAQLSQDGFRAIDSESDKMVYLTDGDDGGREIRSLLHRSGIPATRTFSLPPGVALEDLVSSETLAAAALEELRRSGHEPSASLAFPSTGRASYLDDWCEEAGIEPPVKRAIACRVLELTARRPQADRRLPLLEECHRTALSELHSSFLDVFLAQE